MVHFYWNGDDNQDGLWEDNKRIATLGQLEREGFDPDLLSRMDQTELNKVALSFKRARALPVSVNRGSIEEMLG